MVNLVYARVEFCAIREDIPETYCGLAVAKTVDPIISEEDRNEMDGPMCVRCEILIGHNWRMNGKKNEYACQRCWHKAKNPISGREERCPASFGGNRAVLAKTEDSVKLKGTQKEQWKQQITRLDQMIGGAKNDKERRQFQSWQKDIEAKLKGETMPSEKKRGANDQSDYERRSIRVMEWLEDGRDGKTVTWPDMCTGTKLKSGKLVKVIRQMLRDERIVEEPKMVYTIQPVPPIGGADARKAKQEKSIAKKKESESVPETSTAEEPSVPDEAPSSSTRKELQKGSVAKSDVDMDAIDSALAQLE